VSVFNRPLAWADEMDRMFTDKTINKENYLIDLANAVVYVRETARNNEQLERQLADAQLCIKHLYKCCDSADVYHSMLDAMPSEKAKTLMDRIKEIK